jgi:hypothetical protein
MPFDTSIYLFIYRGIVAGNGSGDNIDRERAEEIADAFREPVTFDRVRTADLYDDAGLCKDCNAFYCIEHWNEHDGFGTCPRGHGKSLDPHWWPGDWDDD